MRIDEHKLDIAFDIGLVAEPASETKCGTAMPMRGLAR